MWWDVFQTGAAEEPVGPVLLERRLGGRLASLASASEEGAVHAASRGRPVLDGLLGLYQVHEEAQTTANLHCSRQTAAFSSLITD